MTIICPKINSAFSYLFINFAAHLAKGDEHQGNN